MVHGTVVRTVLGHRDRTSAEPIYCTPHFHQNSGQWELTSTRSPPLHRDNSTRKLCSPIHSPPAETGPSGLRDVEPCPIRGTAPSSSCRVLFMGAFPSTPPTHPNSLQVTFMHRRPTALPYHLDVKLTKPLSEPPSGDIPPLQVHFGCFLQQGRRSDWINLRMELLTTLHETFICACFGHGATAKLPYKSLVTGKTRGA